MNERLGIAIVGVGSMGRVHAARVRANARCQLVAVAEPAGDPGLGVPSYPDVGSLVHARKLDGAIVATPNHLHAAAAAVLLEAGVPVLIEKPIAHDSAAAGEIVRKARETGVPVLIGHHRRHSPAVQAARACVGSGQLGRIVAVHASTLFHKPQEYFEAAWRREPGGGPILINLIHDIDTLRHLCGEVVAVQAAGSNAVRGFEVEDTAGVLLEFGSGAVGTVVLSDTAVAVRSWEQTSGENPIYQRDASQDCLFIAGTRGSLAIPTMKLWTQTGSPSWTAPLSEDRLEFEPADPLARQLDHFLDVIERRADPLVTPEDAARTLAVTLAIQDAARSRTRVVLDQK